MSEEGAVVVDQLQPQQIRCQRDALGGSRAVAAILVAWSQPTQVARTERRGRRGRRFMAGSSSQAWSQAVRQTRRSVTGCALLVSEPVADPRVRFVEAAPIFHQGRAKASRPAPPPRDRTRPAAGGRDSACRDRRGGCPTRRRGARSRRGTAASTRCSARCSARDPRRDRVAARPLLRGEPRHHLRFDRRVVRGAAGDHHALAVIAPEGVDAGGHAQRAGSDRASRRRGSGSPARARRSGRRRRAAPPGCYPTSTRLRRPA